MGCGMSRARYPYDDVEYQQGAPLQTMGGPRCGHGRGRGCHRRGPGGPPWRRGGCRGRGGPWAAGYGHYEQGIASGPPAPGFISSGPKFEESRQSSMETKVEQPMHDGFVEPYKDHVESGPPRYSKISVTKD